MDKALVLDSVENAQGERCVDFIRNADHSFAFKEFRREAEDPSGWRDVSRQLPAAFISLADAVEAALAAVPWLRDSKPGDFTSRS